MRLIVHFYQLIELEERWLEENQDEGGYVSAGGLEGMQGTFDQSLQRDRGLPDETQEGSQADFVLGMVMGFVFGVIMLFWIWDRGIARRQKLGILCGIGVGYRSDYDPCTEMVRIDQDENVTNQSVLILILDFDPRFR